MSRRLAASPLLLLAVLLAGCSVFSSGPRFDPARSTVFTPGAGATYTIVLDQKDNRIIFDKANPIHMLQEFATTWTVLEQDPAGNWLVEVSIDAYRFERTMPDGSVMAFDSTNHVAADPGLATGLAAAAGGRVRVLLSPRREIVELRGADILLATMLDAMGGDTVANQPIADTVKEHFGESSLRALLATVLPPAAPEGVDEAWVGRRVLPSSYSIVSEEAYTLVPGAEAPVIEALGALVSDFDVKKGSTREEKVNYELLGQTTTRWTLDPLTGWASAATIEAWGDGRLVFLGDFDASNFPDMPTQVRLDVTVTRTAP